MNAQQLEYVCIQLRAALADDSGGTKGQLEAFAEHPPADKNLNPRKMIHVVELDNGRGGVRRVKAENSALYVMETRSRCRPGPPISDNAFYSCAWRRAINKLDGGSQAWLKYCYGGDLSYASQILICERVWSKFHLQNTSKKMSKRMRKCLASLTWLAIQDVATKNNNSFYKEYAAVTLAKLLRVHRDTWYAIFSKEWSALKGIVCSLDEDASKGLSEYLAIK
ncbi:antitermination protein [Enterobacter mori]|uniref:bacteriophage antitermination protein Q n=1 Tax=Enterobacter mori TaxID=539813 RepID=UPI000B801E15|nr:bacteriophage antitermination protein Q [Enterobacter mori]OXL32459.1 antitermination protein [Enterobacter mori]